jgi:hypothetical protein
MNQRQYVRNIGRIPRLLFHIKRVKAKGPDHADRVAGFEDELERRKLEFQLAERDPEMQAIFPCTLKDLLKIKLEHHATADSIKLKEMVAAASKGMTPGAGAEFTPKDK